jgi:hypothetical protein
MARNLEGNNIVATAGKHSVGPVTAVANGSRLF